MEVLIVWLVLAVLVGVLAQSRGRTGFGWFMVSVMLSPLLGLLIVLVIENKTATRRMAALVGEMPSDTTHTRCPECREWVRRDARKCKHCGGALQPAQ